MTDGVKVPSIYDRDHNDCCVVKHPYPDLHAEWLAVYNERTGEFKLDDKGKVRRYSQQLLSSAGFDAADDSAWFREMPHLAHIKKYGPLSANGDEA